MTVVGSESERCNEIIDWLKSLKDKAIPQSKQEWSKEDIDMIDWLTRCCEKEYSDLCNDRYGHQDIVSDLKRDCRKKWDWLDFLKNRVAPQSNWKPSQEQLNALYNVVSYNSKDVCRSHDDILLEELLGQLKKLKDE